MVLVSSGKIPSRCADFSCSGFFFHLLLALSLLRVHSCSVCGIHTGTYSSAALGVLGEAWLQGLLSPNLNLALPEAWSQVHGLANLDLNVEASSHPKHLTEKRKSFMHIGVSSGGRWE